MNTLIDDYDYQRYAILFVDDEANTRKYFKRLFGDKFRILEAEDGVQALSVFREHASEIGIIVTDQRMPNETGVGFLSKIAEDYPDIIKILSTAYSDIEAAIGSVNQGGIFRYITKPWDIPQLEVTLRRAMEFYTVKRERDALLAAKMQAVGNVLLANRLAAFALVPVCAGIGCNHAAQAVASFVKAGLNGRANSDEPGGSLQANDWAAIHRQQLTLAKALENALPQALATSGIEARAKALADTIAAASGTEAECTADAENHSIQATGDPFPPTISVLMGGTSDPSSIDPAMKLMAAFLAVYDAGGSIRKLRNDGLLLKISNNTKAHEESNPGEAAAKWLLDDDMLMSAALGLI